GTGGALSGHGGACLAVLIASVLAASICCLMAPRMSRISRSIALSLVASLSRSSARPRTDCANCRAAVSASNECAAGCCERRDESMAATFCGTSSSRPLSTATLRAAAAASPHPACRQTLCQGFCPAEGLFAATLFAAALFDGALRICARPSIRRSGPRLANQHKNSRFGRRDALFGRVYDAERPRGRVNRGQTIMRIGVLGSGLMGGKLGTLFARAGHDIVFSYARTKEKLKRLSRNAGANALAGTPAEAARKADALLLAVHWSRLEDVLQQAGDVSGKVILNCSLPMNADNTELAVAHTSSGLEELAKVVPKARLVAAFNTVPSEVR